MEPSFKTDTYNFLRSKLPLDLMTIEESLVEMPTLVQQAGEATSAAIEIRDTAEEELKQTKAQVANDLRRELVNNKARSESTIDSMIPLDERFLRKQEELSTARFDASLWMGLVESLRRKDSAIRTAADLLNSGFLTRDFITSKRRSDIRSVKV